MAEGPGTAEAYYVMKSYHDKAYAAISEALDLDESATGDKECVIDLYSQGVAELQKGIDVYIDPSDEKAQKAERLRQQMLKNLEMARERVQSLLDGKDLRGSTLTDVCVPTVSLKAMQSKHRSQTKPKVGELEHSRRIMKRQIKESGGSSSRERKIKARDKDFVKSKQIEIKGVDPSIVELIMNEIQIKDTNVKWDDIVGLNNAKKSLQEIVVYPALNPDLFVGLRTPTKGLLLFGPPGNGKTLLAKAVAHESKSTFLSMSASSLTSKYVGESEKLVKAMFAVARQLQPSIVFIDELDWLLSKRNEGEHDSMRRLKNEFLLQFDGVGTSEHERVLVMGATNRPYEIDDAALRRFTKRIYIPLPDTTARYATLNKLLKQHKHSLTEQQLKSIAKYLAYSISVVITNRETSNYSFSDITALARDAALGPIRNLDTQLLRNISPDQVSPIKYEHFVYSLTQIRSSATLECIKSIEDWNDAYGVA